LLLRSENFLKAPLSESDWWESDADDSSSTASSSEEDEGKEARRFRNLGLHTWSQGRKAWREAGREDYVPKIRQPIPSSFKKELVKCLAQRRQFELSQRIPLGDMIEAYTEAWNGGSSE
jgi:hypothetical protein